ncbi:MAG: addiction module toxin RelE [Kangiella sp.]|nr:MAG: addiction module toxin RelE [Kangiella sp.]
MVRQARIEYSGALYHITSRGNAKQDIFVDDEDRLVFLETLRKARNRYNCIVYAYCLMDNHYHLLVETPDANLSQFMRQLNGVYTQKYNFSHSSTGHLFQGRFKSILVQEDLYLLELCRYIVLNPVRAGMVRSAKDWKWSSYRASANLSSPIDWLNSDWLLSNFSKNHQLAIKQYRVFVSEGKNQASPWHQLKNQVLLGDEPFVKKSIKQLKKTTKDKEITLTKVQPRKKARTLDVYNEKSKNRNDAIYKAYLSGSYSMKQIGDYFGVHYSTVSRVISARCNP